MTNRVDSVSICSSCNELAKCKLIEQGFSELCTKLSSVQVQTTSEITLKKCKPSEKHVFSKKFKTGSIYKVKILGKTKKGLGVASIMGYRIHVEKYVGMKIGDEVRIQIIYHINDCIYSKKTSSWSKTPIMKKNPSVPITLQTSYDGGLITPNPWSESNNRANKNGTSRKCRRCRGKCSWDSNQHSYFCDKCGFEN